MKPIIGILSNVSDKEDESSGIERVFVNNSYVNAVEKAGGVPIIIPVNTQRENIKRQIELVDGIIISGGGDVNPILYNEEPTKEMGCFHPDIDEFDIIAIKIAIELKKTILGICRGIQVLNVALGGTLYQDLSHIKENYIKHTQQTKRYMGSHTVKIIEDSILNHILGTEVVVNSYHHQSVKDLGDGLIDTAYSKDGVIEAIEMKDEKFVVGVQWHPESMVDHDENMLNLFKEFINSSI